MRILIGLFVGAMVLGLAFWAYQENYRTRAAVAEMHGLQRDIGHLKEEVKVLRAEWAYLNRPARLRELVELNFERLGLLPMTPGHFGRIDQIAFPPPPGLAALKAMQAGETEEPVDD